MKRFDLIKNRSGIGSMPKENHQSRLDEIQQEVHLFLKPLGFRKKGRTFNRQTEEGIYQVIQFQSGRFPVGDNYVIPGFRENYYGKFTVNVGVLVKELYEIKTHNKPKDFYQEADCNIRTRLPSVNP